MNQVQRAHDPVDDPPLKDAGQAEAVVTVQVGQPDDVDGAGRDTRVGHLTLGALARIDEDA